jgi:hypothetical protein
MAIPDLIRGFASATLNTATEIEEISGAIGVILIVRSPNVHDCPSSEYLRQKAA